jgi:hypothetical protein
VSLKRVTLLNVFKTKKEYLLKLLLLFYIFSFLGATYNHTMDLVKYGLFPYQKLNNNVSLLLNIYWTMLTIFDFLAIIVLFYYIDIGLLLYGLIILSDVIINYTFMISTKGILSIVNFGQICQMLFLIIYLCTFYYIHKKTQEIGRST